MHLTKENNSFFMIRRATPLDFDEIRRLEHSCFEPEDAFDDELLQRMLQDTRHFVTWAAQLFSKEQLIGYVSLYVHDKFKGLIMSICVMASYRRKGVATMLLNAALDYAKKMNLKAIQLTVSVNNEPAIHLYEKEGFVIRALIPQYYPNGDDAYLMVRTISNQ